ncbi:hypothetical protein J6590_027116 [Homalodisca vitripennis]|nr:hypothetical protein J6590_027116 [Homalodisca vitripennis]
MFNRQLIDLGDQVADWRVTKLPRMYRALASYCFKKKSKTTGFQSFNLRDPVRYNLSHVTALSNPIGKTIKTLCGALTSSPADPSASWGPTPS